MAFRQNFLSSLLGGGQAVRERFSLEELRHLDQVLGQNTSVTDSNRQLLIETLRSLAETMIWGDQHEPSFFEYFAEHNIVQHFVRLVQNSSSTQGEFVVQVRVQGSPVCLQCSHDLRSSKFSAAPA